MEDVLALSELSVLLVEPSTAQANAIARMLRTSGVLRIETVASGQEALAALFGGHYGLVVSAFYLPDMSGADLVRTMRGDVRLADTGFVLISSETRPQALEAVRQSGACGILPKPFSQTQLDTVLAATIDYLGRDDAVGSDFDAEAVRVLLVDDSPSARRFMRRVLENIGISHLVEAANGREAVAILTDTMVDLVITDYNMPEMDGKELVDHIRGQGWQRSVPILMVTSETNSGRLAGIQEAGVSGICDKPFEPSVVRNLLSRLFRAER
jgi:two-component system chemotaxis response regulator CheY